jgi:hypothetical protein
MQKFLFLVCAFISFIQSGYSQQKPLLFKDINTETRSLPLSDFQTVGDSLVYFIAKDHDTLSVYVSNGSTTVLATSFNNGTIAKSGGTDTHFFFRHNNDLYSLKGQTRTFISDATNIYFQNFSHRNRFLFQKVRSEPWGFELWSSDGTLAETIKLMDIGTKSLNFLGTANEYVYFTLYDDASNRQELWKLNINNNQTTLVDFLPNEPITIFNNYGVATNYIFFRNFSNFYVVNNNVNGLTKLPTKKMNFDGGIVINNHLYTSLTDSTYTYLGIHRYNTNTNSFEPINTNAPSMGIAHHYNNHIYVWRSIAYDTKLYRTDSLFQNYVEVPLSGALQNGTMEYNFFYKDSYYAVFRYAGQYQYLWNRARIMKSDGFTSQLSVYFDSFEAGLHRSSLEVIKFEDFVFTKNQFFFNLVRDRINWNSSNWLGLGVNLWKSTGATNGTTEVFKAGKSTLNAGIIGLSADKNDIFFFADTNNGFQLMITDGSAKNLKPFVDSTFQNLSAYPVDKPIYRIGNKLFFQHTSLYSGTVFLAVSDGTKAGTKFVGDNANGTFSNITNVRIHNNLLYFLANERLYATDGDVTTAFSIYSGIYTIIQDYYILDNYVYLVLSKDNKTEMWKVHQTTLAKQKVYEANWDCCSYSQFIGVINNKILFGSFKDADLHIFVSDGTSTGTNLLTIIPHGIEFGLIKQFYYFKNNYYICTASHIIRTDGTQAGTSIIYQASVRLTAFSATSDFIIFYNEGYVYAKTLMMFNGANFNSFPQYSDELEEAITFASRGAAFFRYNKKTYVTYGTTATTAVFCDDPITSIATLSNYTFFNLPTWKYGSELWTLNKCEENMTLSGPFSADQIFAVKKNITGAQQLNNANVIYRAGNAIQLMPGFKANNTSVFKAEIEGCVD